MNDTDRPAFEESIRQCYEMYEAKPNAIDVWWLACHRYPLDAVCKALMAHMQDPADGRYAPRPADVVRRIAAMGPTDGHLPADEAWGVAVQAMNESETVVWTQEIAEAWGTALLIMRSGDEVGARMAFRSAYERRLTQSRVNGRRPTWFPSLGQDPAKRAAALESAAERLRLPRLAEHAAIEDQSRQTASPDVIEWIAQARRRMRMQAPSAGSEVPLDDVIAALPEDQYARRQALAEMTRSQEHRVRHVLGEAEKKRQLDALVSRMTPEQRTENVRRSEGMPA